MSWCVSTSRSPIERQSASSWSDLIWKGRWKTRAVPTCARSTSGNSRPRRLTSAATVGWSSVGRRSATSTPARSRPPASPRTCTCVPESGSARHRPSRTTFPGDRLPAGRGRLGRPRVVGPGRDSAMDEPRAHERGERLGDEPRIGSAVPTAERRGRPTKAASSSASRRWSRRASTTPDPGGDDPRAGAARRRPAATTRPRKPWHTPCPLAGPAGASRAAPTREARGRRRTGRRHPRRRRAPVGPRALGASASDAGSERSALQGHSSRSWTVTSDEPLGTIAATSAASSAPSTTTVSASCPTTGSARIVGERGKCRRPGRRVHGHEI